MRHLYQNLPYYLIIASIAFFPGGWPYALVLLAIAFLSDLTRPEHHGNAPLNWWRRRSVAEVVTHTTRRLMRGVR